MGFCEDCGAVRFGWRFPPSEMYGMAHSARYVVGSELWVQQGEMTMRSHLQSSAANGRMGEIKDTVGHEE